MSRRHHYVTHPEAYGAYYGGAPVRPMVFYQDDGTWRSGYTLQRGRVQYRHSDLSLRANRGMVVVQPSKERPVNRVVPQQQQYHQQQQQYLQQQYQQQKQQQQQQMREAYAKQASRARAKSSSPVRGDTSMPPDKVFAFNALRKEMKDGLSGLKHVTMDIPKLNKKSTPATCYNEMQRTLNAMEKEAKKWRNDLDSIYGRRSAVSAPSTPRSRSDNEIMSELQKQMSTAERKTVEAEEANSKYELLSAECRDLKGNIERLEAEKEQLAREKNEANTRLSEVAGSKLVSGNTNIADLSTENRPTKIAEKFRELYDNEWTEVIEIQGKDDPVEEKKVIAMLLYIVKGGSSMGREGEDLLNQLVKATADQIKNPVVKTQTTDTTQNIQINQTMGDNETDTHNGHHTEHPSQQTMGDNETDTNNGHHQNIQINQTAGDNETDTHNGHHTEHPNQPNNGR
ncbi:hypothetical protein FSP39_015335 [Pinctada imbricata]|uniref:Uncharacterized protein n=1 Tax=Pinctada imbricata TaxID=66713 RepID=A0AA89BZH2_PINIB|nr:hypothetical protein FSP39_015335 [Pinctada imbricata]